MTNQNKIDNFFYVIPARFSAINPTNEGQLID